MKLFIGFIIFFYGITIGSFLNVCILRIPGGENIVTKRSHCTSCGHTLAWYDLVPLFSYLFLRGKCRYCGKHISAQYPIIEALNGVLWVLAFVIRGFSIDTLLICGVISALIVISVIDWRTFEIPFGANVVIFVLGIIRVILKLTIYGQRNLMEYLIGLVAVSGALFIVFLITKGEGIGGGDIKLMAASGLFLGWKASLLALIVGCFLGSVIHITRMKVSGEGRVLAMGPYLSAGILVAMLWGEWIINAYVSILMRG